MGDQTDEAVTPLIERTAPRALFAELIAGALTETRVAPSPMAIAYLVELLESRLLTGTPDGSEPVTLAEGLLRAQLQQGSSRVQRMRSLGDRALFVAGFFGDSLNRSVVDIDYYGDVGRTAYADLSQSLAQQLRERTWPGLYAELAQHFYEFVDVLAEVGDRTRAGRAADLLRVYERYLRTGSARDHRRLMRLGQVPPDSRGLRRWQ